MRHNFPLAEEHQGVTEICRLVGGLPLALELAAAWTKMMDCQTIAAEIQHNIDFLNTRLRNVPARHRSIQAIFEQSWQLLTPSEQTVYARLSVFRGGFGREAAEQVASADLPVLTAFVEKSLLQWEPSGRYQLHELLRQYAAERAAQTVDLLTDSFQAHCTYYTQFVNNQVEGLYGARQLEAIAEIDAELDNIVVAWQWAIDRDLVDNLRLILCPIGLHYQYRSRYVEGAALLRSITDHFEIDDKSTQELVAGAMVALAWYCIRLGQIEEAQRVSKAAHTVLKSLGFPKFPNAHTADPALTLSLVASIQGDYVQAETFAQEALERSHQPGYFWGNQQTANYLLATIAFAQGQFETARFYAEQAYAAAEKVQDRWFMAYCHHELGNVALVAGHYTVAKTYYEAGYTLREAFRDWEGMAVSLNHLGKVALQQADDVEAQQYYRRSLEIYQKINDRGGLASAFDGLGRAAIGRQDFQTARQCLNQGLAIAAEMGFVTLILSLLVSIGQLLCACERLSAGGRLLTAVVSHPAALPDVQSRARQILADRGLGPDNSNAESELQPLIDLAQLELNRLIDNLIDPLPETTAVAKSPTRPSEPHVANQALVEPLTPRELEVLALMAAGLTNQAIADELVVVVGTIKAHTNNIYSKLGVSNRTQAVARGRELGLF